MTWVPGTRTTDDRPDRTGPKHDNGELGRVDDYGELGHAEDFEELVEHLARTTRLGREEATRVVEEVLAYFSETPQEFVCRRHSELRAECLKNPVIFQRIASELAHRRFLAPGLSERQIRRLIYG